MAGIVIVPLPRKWATLFMTDLPPMLHRNIRANRVLPAADESVVEAANRHIDRCFNFHKVVRQH